MGSKELQTSLSATRLRSVVAILATTAMLIGCTHLRGGNDDGLYFIPSVVNPPKHVPVELNSYVQQFEYVLRAHGFTMGDNSDPHAMSLRLEYSGIVGHEKVAAYLDQDNKDILYVYAKNGLLFTKSGGPDLIESLVSKTLTEFSNQVSDFSSQVHIVYARTSSPNKDTKNSNGYTTELGTAFAVDNTDNYVTAYHVVIGAKKIGIHCSGQKTAVASIQTLDFGNDLALLRADAKAKAFLELAPSDSVSIGDHVFTVGFPTPDLLGLDPKYTDGAVSSLTGLEDTKSLMQITVPIQPGNSGGPLMDAEGHVIGVVTSTAAVQSFYHETGTLPQNINWAVPVYYLYPLVKGIRHSIYRKHITPIKRAADSVCLVIAEK